MRRFEHFNLLYFDGRLPFPCIQWSNRMRIAGVCYPDERRIVLSTSYHSHFPEDIDDTLKHEMIHLRIPCHNAAFKIEAARIGTTVHCREYPGLYQRAKHIYFCPQCGTQYRRVRRATLSCGECAPSGYSERYKLILRQPGSLRRAARQTKRKRPTKRRRVAQLNYALF